MIRLFRIGSAMRPPIETLQRMSLFGGIRDDILELVLDIAPLVSVPCGEFFFREGDSAESLFVLQSGRVAVTKGAPGHEHPIRELGVGDCFGEMSLLDLSPRSASVRALEDCTALEISAQCLHAIYERDVEQFAIIEMNIGRELSRRFRAMDAAVEAARQARR